MLPRERVLTTLNHQEPDIIPWGEHWIDYTIYEDVLGRETLVNAKFKETKAWWDGRRDEIIASYKKDTIELAEALGLDIITVMKMPAKSAPPGIMTKVDDETYQDKDGNLWRLGVHTHDLMVYKLNPKSYSAPTLETIQREIDEIDRNGVLPPDDSEWEVVKHVVKEKKRTHFIALVGAPDIDWPTFGQTMEERMLNLVLHPEMCAAIGELNGKRAIASLKHLTNLGIDGLIGCADYGTSSALQASPEIFRKYMFPWHEAYCKEAHRLGFKVIKHCCGNIWEILNMLVEAGYDAYESIQASGGMDIKRLKACYGDQLTLWGGVTNESLIGGTPEKVRQDAYYAIKWAARGGGFIYGASHSLAVGTKLENLMAMKESREKWGTYPTLTKKGRQKIEDGKLRNHKKGN